MGYKSAMACYGPVFPLPTRPRLAASPTVRPVQLSAAAGTRSACWRKRHAPADSERRLDSSAGATQQETQAWKYTRNCARRVGRETLCGERHTKGGSGWYLTQTNSRQSRPSGGLGAMAAGPSVNMNPSHPSHPSHCGRTPLSRMSSSCSS